LRRACVFELPESPVSSVCALSREKTRSAMCTLCPGAEREIRKKTPTARGGTQNTLPQSTTPRDTRHPAQARSSIHEAEARGERRGGRARVPDTERSLAEWIWMCLGTRDVWRCGLLKNVTDSLRLGTPTPSRGPFSGARQSAREDLRGDKPTGRGVQKSRDCVACLFVSLSRARRDSSIRWVYRRRR
jgi:hypothetical protein